MLPYLLGKIRIKIPPLYGTLIVFISGKSVLPANAQGIEAVYFFAASKKDTSGKPGFRRLAPENRPKQRNKFLWVYPVRHAAVT
jgi:hypothetical protein